MYQFYYADPSDCEVPQYQKNIAEVFRIDAVRPTMWEEHCLECSAPLCFQTCSQYEARADGRCKRFYNGIRVRREERGCCGHAARVKFRPWGNMMTIVFPPMLTLSAYQALTDQNQGLGNKLRKLVTSQTPVKLRWSMIRGVEYLRRRKLRGMKAEDSAADAFVFHGYSFEKQPFHLILEVYRDDHPVFRSSLSLAPGENLLVLDKGQLSPECWRSNNLIKIYPENDLEADVEILWCDFVKGSPVSSEKPAAKVKCVVWDLDNTLWDGTLIESEPELLQLRPGVKELIQALDERGFLQSIASKNDYEAAWPVVERLGLAEYFLYPQIHWNAKSASIQQIARDLNIGVDTFALLDDSVFEREQVRSALPQVRCFDTPELPTLLERPEFSVLVTEESRQRRQMYRAEAKRRSVMAEDHDDTISFLKKCHLQVEVFEPKTEKELLRCYELLTRTNQLNMSGVKYSREEFDQALLRDGHQAFAFSCGDDFGDYGIVGFGQYTKQQDKLIMKEFAMSCRVAGKFVESALFASLLEREQCLQGEMCLIKTKKNVLLRNTLGQIGFTVETEFEEKLNLRFTKELLHRNLVKVVYRV